MKWKGHVAADGQFLIFLRRHDGERPACRVRARILDVLKAGALERQEQKMEVKR